MIVVSENVKKFSLLFWDLNVYSFLRKVWIFFFSGVGVERVSVVLIIVDLYVIF